MHYAVVDSKNFIVNVVVWDGESGWQPPEGCIAVPIPENSLAGIGCSYADGDFICPVPEEPVLPSEENLAATLTEGDSATLEEI